MKTSFASALVVALATTAPLFGHGPGHIHRTSALIENQALDLSEAPATSASLPGSQTSASGKSFKQPIVEVERWWGASLTTGWESRHVHYGVNESGDAGAYTTEVSAWIHSFTFSVWNGFGTGSEFQEWDFTAGYNLDLGPVFLIPGYNLRYTPRYAENGHSEEDHHEDHHDEEEHHDEHASHEEDHGGHSHTHKTYGNEVFLVLGTTKIPYVTPTVNFIWDLNNTPGGFLEFRINGDIPVYRDIITLEPYALLGINLGYNTDEYYGWNNFQFGLQANWQINRIISAFAGINYSVAMTALREINQGNEVWANVGVTFTY